MMRALIIILISLYKGTCERRLKWKRFWINGQYANIIMTSSLFQCSYSKPDDANPFNKC